MKKIIDLGNRQISLEDVDFQTGFIVYEKDNRLYRLICIEDNSDEKQFCFISLNTREVDITYIDPCFSESVRSAIKVGLGVKLVSYKELLYIMTQLGNIH